MPNISGHKMMCHIDRIVGDPRPITADIFLTNYCNNKCPYCTYGRWELDDGVRAMSIEDFAKYALRMQDLGVKGFILTGGGEPTVNPDFEIIATWLTEMGMRWGINTNFNKLVNIKPDYLKVSLDGYDEDSYERARGVRKYGQVRNNIEAYAKWKAANSPNTALGIQMVAMSADDVMRFYDANSDLDVDYIAIRPVESTAGKYYRELRRNAGGEADRSVERILETSLDRRRSRCSRQARRLTRRSARMRPAPLPRRQETPCEP